MRGPQVGGGVFPQSFPGGRANKVKCTLSVWTKSYTSTNFTERWGRIVDLDVNVGILEEANSKTPEQISELTLLLGVRDSINSISAAHMLSQQRDSQREEHWLQDLLTSHRYLHR